MEPHWQRLLYVKQDFPDNYVDASFLQQMRRNVHVRPLSFMTVALETTSVSSQFSAVLLFVGVFMQLYEDMLSPMTLVVGSSGMSLLGYLVWDGFLQPKEIPGAPPLVNGSTRVHFIVYVDTA
jgi:phosphatidylinositol glycan class C protein